MILKKTAVISVVLLVLCASAVVILLAVSRSLSESSQQAVLMPPEAQKNLQEFYELTEIPEHVNFLEKERYTDCPFQGPPLDGIYSRHFKKVMATITEQEKMLAFGWVNPKAENYWKLDRKGRTEYYDEHRSAESRGWFHASFNPVWTVVFLYRRFYEKQGRAPQNTWELIRDGWYGEVVLTGKASATGGKLDNTELLLPITSPVTGKLIEFGHEELSPGNMWITIVDKKTLDKVAEDWVGVGPGASRLPMTEFEGIIYYYRVYGYEGIIRTGMLLVTEYSVGIE